jgi:hypothetical protein
MSSGSISEKLKAKIRTSAGDRCGYCRSLQMYVLGLLEIEHIIPKAKGGDIARISVIPVMVFLYYFIDSLKPYMRH